MKLPGDMLNRNLIMLLLLFSILPIWMSCSGDNGGIDPVQGGEQLYTNGAIYTVNEQQPWAEAMLVKDGVIVAIGTIEEVTPEASSDAQVADLSGAMVMPGIHDVHLHPLEAASDNFRFILDGTETDPENYARDIADALDRNSNSPWLLGWGYDFYTILDTTREPIEILDDISSTQAIIAMEQTSHSIWVNSKALELAGIDENTPDPTGGVIMKDEFGFPNGLLIDNAGNLVVDLAIASIPDSEANDYDGLINFALPELARNGITSICDARTYWKRNHHETWRRAEEEGQLTVRANLGLWVYPTEDDDTQIATIQSLYSNDPNSFLKINQIKLYADGIVINTTAALHTNYLLNILRRTANNGLNYITQERMARYIEALEPTGFDFHIHAIGDRGVHEALNAIERSGTANGRHRLTHIEYVDPADYDRFTQLNVTADAQVVGDFAQPENWNETDELIGSALNNAVIPIRSLSEANARITLSSDWDVSALNPFVGLQNAVTRTPQNLTLAEAIKAYTLNAAYVMRQEDKVGSLEVSKEADFIVLNQNIFQVDPSRINQTRVIRTYLRGELIHSN
ncbi:MAG: amidohydrolase [Cytophagales bacterium]|nr:amidohydrolase [Cytophagales bacterium]